MLLLIAEAFYSNIGKKIKGLAFIVAALGMIGSFIGGILYVKELADSYLTEDIAFVGYIVMFAGIFLSWVLGFFVYGFGELIDQTMEINKQIKLKEQKAEEKKKKLIEAKKKKLIELRKNDLITEEEFEIKISALSEV